jgi:hypothetical protein
MALSWEFKTLKEAIPKEMEKIRKQLAPMLRAATPGKAEVGTVLAGSPAYKKKVQRGVDEFNALVGPGLVDGKQINFHYAAGRRAGYYDKMKMVSTDGKADVATIMHEMGHWLEKENPEVLAKASELWRTRTASDDFKSLKDLYPGDMGKHMVNEYAKRDEWLSPYMGKVYFKDGGTLKNKPSHPSAIIDSTEIVSMGIETLWEDPLHLAYNDPKTFDFIWSVINGKR